MSQKNRSRPIGIKLRFTQQELQLVAEKMEQLGTTNREAYLRKMAIDGYVLKLDVPELKEMVTLLRRMQQRKSDCSPHERNRAYLRSGYGRGAGTAKADLGRNARTSIPLCRHQIAWLMPYPCKLHPDAV